MLSDHGATIYLKVIIRLIKNKELVKTAKSVKLVFELYKPFDVLSIEKAFVDV